MCNKSQNPDKLCTQRVAPSIGWGCWGSTPKTPDTLASALKTGFEQAVSGVSALKKLQPLGKFYVKCSSMGGVAC